MSTIEMPEPQLLAYVPERYLLPGYPKLAGRMEILPEIAIFRRFGALNTQRLLRMQAELIQLEQRLRDCEAVDSIQKKKAYSIDWKALKQSTADGDPGQLKLVQEIDEKLKEYSKSTGNPLPSLWSSIFFDTVINCCRRSPSPASQGHGP